MIDNRIRKCIYNMKFVLKYIHFICTKFYWGKGDDWVTPPGMAWRKDLDVSSS